MERDIFVVYDQNNYTYYLGAGWTREEAIERARDVVEETGYELDDTTAWLVLGCVPTTDEDEDRLEDEERATVWIGDIDMGEDGLFDAIYVHRDQARTWTDYDKRQFEQSRPRFDQLYPSEDVTDELLA